MLATNYGCCSAFPVLSKEGCRVLNHVLQGLDKHAKSCPRIPKLIRGGTFRSRFLNGMGHSEAILRHVSNIAGCEMVFHPMKIHQLHINMKPTGAGVDNKDEPRKKNVDRWHCDSTPFVLVVFCTDPNEYTGGQLQYFDGPREEGMALLSAGNGLPADRVLNVGRQEKGYGVLMQGWRVFHQVTPVLSGDARTTIVFSFHPRNVLALEACTHLSQTYAPVDPLHVILPDWVRFCAWKVMRRLEMLQEKLFPDQVLACSSPSVSMQELFETLNATYAKLEHIVHTLPYTRDRNLCAELLASAVAELNAYLTRTYPDLMTEKYGVECVRSASHDDEPGNKPSITSVADMAAWGSVTGCTANSNQQHSLHELYQPATTTTDGASTADGMSPALAHPHSEDFLRSPFGLPNLLGAVEDIDRCVQDVLTLREDESKLIYF